MNLSWEKSEKKLKKKQKLKNKEKKRGIKLKKIKKSFQWKSSDEVKREGNQIIA